MYLVSVFTEVFAAGGIQRLNRQVCLALSQFSRREGHRVEFLSLMDHSVDVDDHFLEGSVGIRCFDGSKLAFTAAVLQKLSTPLDVLYLAHVSLAPLGLIMRFFRPSLSYGVALYGVEAWRRLPFFQRCAVARASFLTSISDYTSERAVELNELPANRIHLVPPALDPLWNEVLGSACEEKSELSLPSGPIILTVTRLAAHDNLKGVDCVIRAMPAVIEAIPDAHYLVVGTGADVERLQSLARDEGVSDRVSFLGELSECDLRMCYEECDVFAMPSRKEGFGIVFLEAMFYKKPVIAGDHGGSREIVEDGRTGILVQHGDIESITEAILRVLSDRERASKMGLAGYRRLLSEYTYERFREKFLNLISQQEVSG